MHNPEALAERLQTIGGLQIAPCVPLSLHTRFGIGGPARFFVETADEGAFAAALSAVRDAGAPFVTIGGGTNLVVSDDGFDGFVLRFTGAAITRDGARVLAGAGASLQALVDYSIDEGLRGLETMTGIPGSVGGAVYGNAGAYGRSICESVRTVRCFDDGAIREFGNAECEFHYRESAFKRHKSRIILSAELELGPGDAAELRSVAAGILDIRNRKYPPTMKCAGSIFKNLILSELAEAVRRRVPASVVREGKIPSAWFLEQVGAKGMEDGDIHVADYHANLIYNAGSGTAVQVRGIVRELKDRVRREFGLLLEEEVQYVGFEG
jgi:UDP-N-acetylmuramate dehydrogenase